ncbi:M28 family metallopeptidase [Candidatus Zixiibacteriota bacterium]
MTRTRRYLHHRPSAGIAILVLITLLSGRNVIGQEESTTLEQFQREIVMRLTGGADILPGIRLSNRTSPEARALVRAFMVTTLDSLGLDPQRQSYRENGENVYALLPATTQSDEYIVLGAHFDSARRSPGANDDATGCAAVLGVASYLVSLPERSKNIFFVLFDEEERGLVGSRAFAEMLQEKELAVVAVHTIDQMGWDADGDRAIELELPYDGAVELYREAATASDYSAELHITEEPGSDHTAFRRLGMPAVGLTEEYRNRDTTPHIHRQGDTWDTVDFVYLAIVTRLIQSAMAILTRPGHHQGVISELTDPPVSEEAVIRICA